MDAAPLEERNLQQVGHCDKLPSSIGNWEELVPHASALVKSWITHGVPLPAWRSGAPRVRSMDSLRAHAAALAARQRSWDKEDFDWAVTEVNRLVECKLLEEVGLQDVRELHPVFVVKKPKRRLISDLRDGNRKFAPPPRFRVDGLSTIEKLIQADDWMFKTDIVSAYHLLHLAPEARPFFCFVLGDRVFRWVAMPLGWSWAPYVWTTTLKPVVQEMRSRFQLRTSAYLDDVWGALPSGLSRQARADLMMEVRRFLARLGIPVHQEKSVWVPTRQLEILGWRVDSHKMELEVPKAKAKRLVRELRELSRHNRVRVNAWASVLGRFRALRDALRLALLSTRAWAAEVAKAAATVQWTGWWFPSARSRMEVEAAVELLQSKVQLTRPFGLAGATHIMTTDASSWGWGATLHRV